MAALVGRIASLWLLFWLLGVLVPDLQFDWAYGMYAVVFAIACLGCTHGLHRTLRAFADPIQIAHLDVRRCEENLEVVDAGKRYALVAVVFALLAGIWSVSQNAVSPWLGISYWVVGAFQGWLIAFLLVDALATSYRERRLACIEGRERESEQAAFATAATRLGGRFSEWFGRLTPRRKVALVALVLIVFLIGSPFSDDEPRASALADDARVVSPVVDPIPDVHRVELGTVHVWDGETQSVPTRFAVTTTIGLRRGCALLFEEDLDAVADEFRRSIRVYLLRSLASDFGSIESQVTLATRLERHVAEQFPAIAEDLVRVYVGDFAVTPYPSLARERSGPVEARSSVGPMIVEEEATIADSPTRTSASESKNPYGPEVPESRGSVPTVTDPTRLEQWLDLPAIRIDQEGE